jgi:hypothetical protein
LPQLRWALTQTNTGGEIAVLDTAGYGTVTINKSDSVRRFRRTIKLHDRPARARPGRLWPSGAWDYRFASILWCACIISGR